MRLFTSVLVAVAFILILMITSQTAWGQHPSYLLLRTPAAPTHHRPTYGYYPGYGFGVESRSYSYGWFGVRPRRHWTRHFGYYQNYTEWSAR